MERLREDPVGLVHPYPRDDDREVVALFASCLAYGRVELLRRGVLDILDPLGDHPAEFLRQADEAHLDSLWRNFRYRMTGGDDVRDLASAIASTLKHEASLQGLYLDGHSSSEPIADRDAHLQLASAFVRRLRARRRRDELHRGFRYLLPDPADGSACKRLHLYFRWIARGPDPIDLGIWDCIDPCALIMPLDTHTSRICRYLGLLERKSVDGKAARQVTEELARFDAEDPLRYDFALCHLGISQQCIHRRCPDRCPRCPIEPACILAAQPPL